MSDDQFETNDSSLIIDMDAVEKSSFEVLPKGIYECVIENAEFAFSKSSGKPMWTITLVVVDGAYANNKLFTFVSFSEKALPMSKATIARIAPELLSSTFDPAKIIEDGLLIGKNVRAKTVIEKYEGDDRSRVKDMLASKAGGDFLDG